MKKKYTTLATGETTTRHVFVKEEHEHEDECASAGTEDFYRYIKRTNTRVTRKAQ